MIKRIKLDPVLNVTDNTHIMSDNTSKKNNYEKASSWEIFDKIYQRYDKINTILSAGILRFWRKKLVSLFPVSQDMKALDCATGTGEVMFSVMNRYHQSIVRYIGLDLSKNMMAIGDKRREDYEYSQKIEFVHGSGTQIPYEDQTFDCVTMAFGIRNIVNFQECLSELYRVLKSSGSVMIMEFSLPKNSIIKGVYLLYFRWILPFIGGLLSGDRDAYSYLNKTVESFPYGDAFKKELEHVGFSVSMTTLSFGIATLYIGKK